MKSFRIFFIIAVSVSAFSSLISYGNSIGDIEMYFCETTTGQDSKTLSLTGEAKQAIPLCISFYNKSETPTSININFVDGTITNDGSKKKACLEEGTKKVFGQYVQGINTDKIYTLDGRSTLILTGSLLFPDSYVGEVIGCLTYATVDQQSTTGSINVFVRKANIIIASLSGEIRRDIAFVGIHDKIDAIVSPDGAGKYTVSFSLMNSGNITESVILNGKLTNKRGFSQDIDIPSKEIAPGIKSDYTSTLELPWYSADYTIKISGKSMPIFLLPGSKYSLNNTGSIALGLTTVFTTPRSIHWGAIPPLYLLIGSIIIVFIISLIILMIITHRRRRKAKLSRHNSIITGGTRTRTKSIKETQKATTKKDPKIVKKKKTS